MKRVSNNPRIIKAQYILECANGDKVKMGKAFLRVREMLASTVLGRGFNEDIEDYVRSNSGVSEFSEWSNGVVISNDYCLVDY